ncbi:MAG: hypothetical protein IJW37_03625 [Lachnospiraceae bacterium]|nr:hypothetical protein [Lachnospiraceae bacterium]
MVIDFKCPKCAANMEYDSELGKLHCASCDYTEAIEDAPEIEEEQVSAAESVTEGEQEFICDSCGAAVVAEPETSATICAYCGSPVALGARLRGEFAPDKVIPFTVSKEEAKAFYKKWAKNGLLTPKDFMTEKRLGEITGVYVPFWLYDLNVNAVADCLCTKKRSYRSGDYIIHETHYYNVYRQANLNYEKVPADASVKMDDTTMDCLEPYNYAELKNFNPKYLAGFQAEKYGEDADGLLGRIRLRVKDYAERYLKESIRGYATTTYNKREVRTEKQKHYYTLLPVWTLNYEYQGENRTYTMNGQTGKIVGKPPISKAKVAKWAAILYGGSFAVLTLLAYLLV